MIRLDILSDPICPWCFIGWTHLTRALEARPEHPFAIEWHPFMLNPDMAPEGMDRRAYLEGKFGGKAGANEVYGRIKDAAEAAGVSVDFDAIQRTPSTVDAHRLIHWAGLEGRQTPVKLGLFKAYFQQGRDIGDRSELLQIAETAGLDRDMIARLLDSDADRDDILKRDAHARSRGGSGVPTFIVAEQHAVPGAQPPEVWLKVIDELSAQAATAP